MKYWSIRKKIREVGFDEFYQAGCPNKFHLMNVVAESRILNKQFWICVEGHTSTPYELSSRPLDDCQARCSTARFKRQGELIEALERVRLEIQNARRLKLEGTPKTL